MIGPKHRILVLSAQRERKTGSEKGMPELGPNIVLLVSFLSWIGTLVSAFFKLYVIFYILLLI